MILTIADDILDEVAANTVAGSEYNPWLLLCTSYIMETEQTHNLHPGIGTVSHGGPALYRGQRLRS